MKLLHIILSVLGLGILTSCKKSGYDTKNGLVYYKKYHIESADQASFQELNAVFAKDKNHAYYRGMPLTGINGAAFNALDDHYGKDQSYVFYCDNYLDFNLFDTKRKDKVNRVLAADAGSFRAIKDEYAKDKFRAYHKGVGFAVADVDSFEPLDNMFAKDKKVGYYFLKPISGSEGSSFEVLSTNYAKDRQNVYCARKDTDDPSAPSADVIKGVDSKSFTVVGMYHAADKARAYYQDKPLEAADPATFSEWGDSNVNYASDSIHIYIEDRLIRGADKASFRLLTDGYAQDSQTVYYEDESIKNSDLTSFSILESGYAKDGKWVYYEGDILNGGDPVSFALVGNEADRDAADKTHSYYNGRRVKLKK